MPCGGGHYGDLMTGHMVQIVGEPEEAIITAFILKIY